MVVQAPSPLFSSLKISQHHTKNLTMIFGESFSIEDNDTDNLTPPLPCLLFKGLWLSTFIMSASPASWRCLLIPHLEVQPCLSFHGRIFHPLQFLSPGKVLHTLRDGTGLPRLPQHILSGHSFVVAPQTPGAAFRLRRLPPPPAAPCRLHHQSPPLCGTPPPRFTWGFPPFTPLDVEGYTTPLAAASFLTT